MRHALVILLFGMAAGCIPDAASAEHADAAPIVLATAALSPLSPAPEHPGFVSALAAEAFRRLGRNIQVDRLPAERALISANQGLVDGDLLRIAGMDKIYPNLLPVPEPLFEFEFMGFALAGRGIGISGWPDLASYSVGYVRGWKFFEQHLPAGGNVTGVARIDLLLELLRKDRVDIILLDRWQTLWAARDANVAVRAVGPPFATVPLYFYLHSRHADLIGPLTEALIDIKRDGTYAALWERLLTPVLAR